MPYVQKIPARERREVEVLQWEHWVERPYSPFIATLCFAGVDKKYFNKVGLRGFGYSASLYQFPNFLYPQEIGDENLKLLRKRFPQKSIFFVSQVLKEAHAKNKRETRLLLQEKSDPLKKLKKAREIIRTYFPFLWILRPLEEHYSALLAKEVPRFVSQNVEAFIGDASVPKKLNMYGKMLQALLDGEAVSRVQRKFGWIKSRDGFTDFYTASELEEMQKNARIEERKDVEIPKPLRGLFREVRELTFFRTDRTEKYYEILGLLRPIFEEVAQYTGISFKELSNYDVDALLEGKLQRVETPFAYLYLDGKQFITKDPIIVLQKNKTQEIKGNIAFKGIVRGRVKIVRHPSEVGKVLSGDVLVSQMTLPSFISAMQKAVAFVTDEGGLTCHAAIVAREMKKPCIIGTKNATKVLKDGMLVEVEAIQGRVTILENLHEMKVKGSK